MMKIYMNWIKSVIVPFVLMLVAFTSGIAQTVGYTHKPLAAEGCSMKYSIAKQDSVYSIVVTVKSDRLQFLSNPTMMLRTFKDDVLKLSGAHIGGGSETGGIVIGNVICPVTEISSTAQFYVTPEQIELIKEGVKKVRLSTTPIVHEKSFSSDKIGKKLYKFYLKTKEKEEDF